MYNIAIFASGSGSNAEAIAAYFSGHKRICIKLIISNKKDAGVRQRAERMGIPFYSFTNDEMEDGALPIRVLRENQIDLIVLAGYMRKITVRYFEEYGGRILNIHPALLPKYGGKGMYGDRVHKAVLEAKEKGSGITIHLVDEKYDNGRILCQATCRVLVEDSIETLAARIHPLEWQFYPPTIESYLLNELENKA